MKQKKILFAAVDIGWRINRYKKLLKRKHKSAISITSFVKYKVPASQFKASYDYEFNYQELNQILQWSKSLSFFSKAIFRYDVFHFFSGETILTRKLRKLEFIIYRIFNKFVSMHFVGSDIRNPEYLYWKAEKLFHPEWDVSAPKIQQQWQLKLKEDSLRFANKIVVSTPDLLEIIPSAKYLPILMDHQEFESSFSEHTSEKDKFFNTQKIRILHAPSNTKTKGSKYIDLIVKELVNNQNHRFEYIYTPDLKANSNSLYSVNRYDLFQLYREADIVIDQMVIGWYGQQSLEALLSKNAVVCYIDPLYSDHLKDNFPIFNASFDKLSKRVEEVASLIEEKAIDFNSQIEWVKENHSEKALYETLETALNLRSS
ncbi:MAG: hypothetical protein RIC95_12220 [Vicingaceae bacterium]